MFASREPSVGRTAKIRFFLMPYRVVRTMVRTALENSRQLCAISDDSLRKDPVVSSLATADETALEYFSGDDRRVINALREAFKRVNIFCRPCRFGFASGL